MSQEDQNKEPKSSVGNKIAIGTVVLALISLLTAFFNNGGLKILEVWLATRQTPTSTSPSPSPTPTLSPSPTPTPSPSPTPSPTPTPSSLEGNYSLTWVAKTGTYCEAGAIQQLTISSDGLMQGVYNVDQRVTFNGKVDSDGTWSGGAHLSVRGGL